MDSDRDLFISLLFTLETQGTRYFIIGKIIDYEAARAKILR